MLSPCATSEPRRRLSATFVLCDKFTSEVYLLRSSEKLKKANQVSAIAAGSAIQIKRTVFQGRTTELPGLRPDRPAVYYLPTHPSPVYSCNLNLWTGSTRNLQRTDHTTGDNSTRQSLPFLLWTPLESCEPDAHSPRSCLPPFSFDSSRRKTTYR